MTYMSPGRRLPLPRRPPNTSIYDDLTQLGGTLPTVNQTESPADLQEAGVFWHDLGVYQAASGTLIMQLGTDGSGEVLANAAMVVPLETAPVTNLAMDSFGVDSSGNLSVTYTINGEDSPPFSIGIYGSPDGRQAGLLPSPSGGGAGGEGGLLQTYDITDPTLLGGGGQTYTVSIPPDLSGDSSPYLVAMLDCYDQVTETSKADNVSSPLSGVFQNGDGAVYVMGSDSVNENVTFLQNPAAGATTVTINGAAQQFSGAAALYVATGGGNDTIDASGVNLPLTAYAGSGSDTIIGSAGNDEIYGGSGADTIYGGTGNNWIQAGSGNATIYGGPEDDWLYGGSGTDKITGGSGTEVIHGGSGTDTLIGGSGLDDIYGGSGTNFIYGNGANDILEGGSGQNFIQPNPSGSLGSIQVKDSNNNLTFDGTIDASGNTYSGDYQAIDPNPDLGYGGAVADWSFNNFNSGARLGAATSTPVAVYATWQSDGSFSPGTQWAANAVYTVYDVTADTTLGALTVNQADAPLGQSPEPNDRPWTRLGVWNVPVGDTIQVELSDSWYASGDMLCAGDVMIHAIWPTVSIRPTNVTVNPNVASANAGDYVDWVDACQEVNIFVNGYGGRVEFQLQASINPLYTNIENQSASMSDWQASLNINPADSVFEFWSSSTGGSALNRCWVQRTDRVRRR